MSQRVASAEKHRLISNPTSDRTTYCHDSGEGVRTWSKAQLVLCKGPAQHMSPLLGSPLRIANGFPSWHASYDPVT